MSFAIDNCVKVMFNSLNLKNIGFFHTNNGIYYNSQNYYNIYIKRHVLFISIKKKHAKYSMPKKWRIVWKIVQELKHHFQG